MKPDRGDAGRGSGEGDEGGQPSTDRKGSPGGGAGEALPSAAVTVDGSERAALGPAPDEQGPGLGRATRTEPAEHRIRRLLGDCVNDPRIELHLLADGGGGVPLHLLGPAPPTTRARLVQRLVSQGGGVRGPGPLVVDRVDDVLGEGTAGEPGGTSVLALPLALDDGTVGMVVAFVPTALVHACEGALVGHHDLLAIEVDRLRTRRALRERQRELDALRQQLDAYALDFRSTFDAERHRSEQLGTALAELQQTYRATVHGLAIAVEAKDAYTGGHLQRVSRYGMMLTRVVAPAAADDPQMEYGFLLHDVGKLMVPDAVLAKPGELTPEEWVLIHRHPEAGCSILEDIPFLDGAREIVYAHHERWDGRGYPRGLSGEAIPLGARIFPICDAFDAMTSDRPYRRALGTAEAMTEVKQGSGSQFWPDAVEAFLSIPKGQLEEIRTIRTPAGGD